MEANLEDASSMSFSHSIHLLTSCSYSPCGHLGLGFIITHCMARSPLQLLAGTSTPGMLLSGLAMSALDLQLFSEHLPAPSTDPTHQAGVPFHTT